MMTKKDIKRKDKLTSQITVKSEILCCSIVLNEV